MSARQPRAPAGPPRGILRRAPPGRVDHQRLLPGPTLAPFVAHFWSVRWDLRAPWVTETLPHPSVHLTCERGRGKLTGVPRARFSRRLRGAGTVFGIKFRPAAFAPFLSAPWTMARLTGRVVPAADLFGPAAVALARAITAASSFEAQIALAEAFLAARLPPLPAEVAALRDLVERMASDRTLLRAEDAARAARLDLRTLQRRFRVLVGVTPKWVIKRYRLHEAAERLAGPDPPALAALAAELGYFDQPHFARDFKAVIGRTPRAFAKMEARREPG